MSERHERERETTRVRDDRTQGGVMKSIPRWSDEIDPRWSDEINSKTERRD